MQADDITFTEGNDFGAFFLSAGFTNQLLESDGSAGRCVFFVGVVALENLARIIVAESGSGGAGNLEEEIYADGEIRAVKESCLVLLDQGADAIDVIVPACGADDHVLSGVDAGFDVGNDRVRRGEVDDGIDVVELFFCERGAGEILFGAGDLDSMLALGGDFRDERSGFASA